VARLRWLPVAALAALLAGCGSTGEPDAPPGPAGTAMPTRGTGTVDVGGRPVTVHVPASYDPATPAPLVIALHGYTSNAAELESYLRLTPEADRRGFVYAYPDGSTGSRGERFWNATDACCSFGGSGPDDSRYLSDLITKIQDTYRIDRARVYVLGHSNGGFMSFRMACDHADQIAAIAAINGATWADAARCKPSEPVSVLAIHSSADETIAHGGGAIGGSSYPSAAQTVAQWVAHDRCATTATDAPALDLVSDLPGAETAVREYVQGCAGGAAVRSWTVNGGKHVPALGPAFAPAMLDFLLSRAKPAR
jgi:polyhydroxybutyrate depolymerase